MVIRVDESKSKVRKSQSAFGNVVGQPTALRALNRWKEYLISINEEVTDQKYIFCNQDGAVINDFREGFNAVIEEAGVETDANGNKHVIYSLRHTYITFRLQFGEKISIYALAKNCRTSVSMIEAYYDDTVTTDLIDQLTL